MVREGFKVLRIAKGHGPPSLNRGLLMKARGPAYVLAGVSRRTPFWAERALNSYLCGPRPSARPFS
eukprot:4540490-Lingulodinium_polyedra.AAC.1